MATHLSLLRGERRPEQLHSRRDINICFGCLDRLNRKRDAQVKGHGGGWMVAGFEPIFAVDDLPWGHALPRWELDPLRVAPPLGPVDPLVSTRSGQLQRWDPEECGLHKAAQAAAIPVIGALSGRPPTLPENPASPKLKMPPSEATSQ
jgi:hypothetical protein